MGNFGIGRPVKELVEMIHSNYNCIPNITRSRSPFEVAFKPEFSVKNSI